MARRVLVLSFLSLALCACMPERSADSGSDASDTKVPNFNTDTNGDTTFVFPDTGTSPDVSGDTANDIAADADAVEDVTPDVAPDVTDPPDVADVPDAPEDTGAPVEDVVTPDVDAEEPDVDAGTPDSGPLAGAAEGVVWHENGDPAQGVAVTVVGHLEVQTVTNAQGFFLLTAVPAGERSFLFGPTATGEAALVPWTIKPDLKANLGIVTLGATGSVEGTVVAEGAPDQSKSWVVLPGTGIKTSTNPLGAFLLSDLPSGCTTLEVQRTGYQMKTFDVCVIAGTTVDAGVITIYEEGVCITDCTGKVCGDDGCGGSCGQCEGFLVCDAGACKVGGVCPNATCEWDMGETCGNCAADCGCDEGDVCLEEGCCTPQCGGKECGGDGCGGSCGTCGEPLSCVEGACVVDGGSCGNGSCESELAETCKTCVSDCGCGEGGLCMPDQVCCTPQCGGKECGEDGCGGVCGSCPKDFTCTDGACLFECSEVDPTEVADQGPMPTPDPPGTVQSWTGDGYQDDWLVGPTGKNAVAVRRDWGGSIVYLGAAMGTPGVGPGNMVDASNGTRGIHVELADPTRAMQGCAHDASCVSNPAGACTSSPTFRGWSPVQGVNECGSLPGVDSFDAVPEALSTGTTLLQWNPDWALASCDNGGCFDPAKQKLPSQIRYEQSVRFVGAHVIELQMSVENLGDTAYALGAQELPVIWAAAGQGGTAALTKAVDSAGLVIPLAPAAGGGSAATFSSDGGWAMLQTAALDQALGLVNENGRSSFQVLVKEGASVRFSSPLPAEIPPKGMVRARSYLVVGDPDTVRSSAASLVSTLAPFGELESPAPDQTVSQTLHVEGWVLDNLGIESLELYIDGVKISNVYLNIERPDVCAAYPGYPSCGLNGFQASASLAGLTACGHTVEVRATDTTGNVRTIAKRRFFAGAGTPCEDVAACEDGDPCTIDVCDPTLGCVRGPKPEADLKEETCNNLDDDCDGEFDEAPAKGCLEFYMDADEDAWGTSEVECLCKPAYPFSAFQAGDCDDEDPGAWPGSTEECNGVDDDCDGLVDEVGASGCVETYKDVDGDDFGTGDPQCLCPGSAAPWTAVVGGDCNDASWQVNPAMPEACNGFDDDCDGALEVAGVCPEGTNFVYRYAWKTAVDADHSFGLAKVPPTGYKFDGFAFVLFKDPGADRVPLFQSLCIACTDHKQQIDIQEDYPTYKDPQLLGYCGSSQSGLTPKPLYRLYNEALSDHTVTIYESEVAAAEDQGYVLESTLCWVP
jgi:hypothetical protein